MRDKHGATRDPGKDLIDWGVATLALTGEYISGDLHLVKPVPNGVLVAVVDGLGHGREAADAAAKAVATLERNAQDCVISLVNSCHQALLGTRGVVLGLAAFNADDNAVTWVGVGDVEGWLLRAGENVNPARQGLIQYRGVVGYKILPWRASVVPVAPGDTLIVATDGIRSDFAQSVRVDDPPQQIADYILAHHGRGTDDALALVVRWKGPGANIR